MSSNQIISLLTYFIALVIGTMGGCVTWDLSEGKARLSAYNDCLRNMHGRDVVDIQMFCDKIKEKL